MSKSGQVVMITPIITTTLKYPAAVGEARMLQSAQNDAFPGVTRCKRLSLFLCMSWL